MTCTNVTAAQEAYNALIAGEDFSLPVVDLDESGFTLPSTVNTTVSQVTNTNVTSGEVNGTGTFDLFAAGISAHLQSEYEANRITGADFTKAYISLMESALVQSVQFVLNKEQTYWQSQLIQAQAITARVALLTAKVQLAQAEMDAKTSAANFALTKAKILESDLASCAAQYNLDVTLPKQTSLLHSQIGKTNADIGIAVEQRLQIIKQTEAVAAEIVKVNEEIALVQEQKETARGNTTDTRSDGTPIVGLVGNQITKTMQEIAMIKEQIETARANTSNTRLDGTPIAGAVGKQVSLHQAQIDSFARDNETKIAKLMVDMWMAQKTIDEGLSAPTGFDNTNMNTVMSALRNNVGV